jgi:hypothetical protein
VGAASGIGPIGYQWYFEQTNLLIGSTNATLALPNVQLTNAGFYTLVASNPYMAITSNPVYLNVGYQPGFSLLPLSQTALVGERVTFSAISTGSPPNYYQWRKGSSSLTAPIQDLTNFTLLNLTTGDAGLYRAIASNPWNATPGIASPLVLLTVLADTDGDGMPDDWEAANGFQSTDSLDATLDPDGDGMSNVGEYRSGTNPLNPLSVLRFNSAVFSGGALQLQFNQVSNIFYWIEFYDPEAGSSWTSLIALEPRTTNVVASVLDPGANVSAFRYYRLRAARANGGAKADAIDTLVYSRHTVEIGTNLVVSPSFLVESRISVLIPSPPDGACVWKQNIGISSYETNCYAEGLGWENPVMTLSGAMPFFLLNPGPSFEITFLGIASTVPPAIVTQSLSQTVTKGNDVNLNVVASGLPAPDYQWFFNGHLIPGANAASLSLIDVDAAQSGAYRVVVSNGFGVATSEVATVTVHRAPQITVQPQSQTVLVGQPVSFTVEASGSLPLGFRWLRNGTLLTNLVLNQNSSTLSFASVQLSGSASYRVVVTNAANPAGVTSDIAALTVLAPVGIVAQPTNTTAALGGGATFCISATGSAPIRYQWRHNGASIPGATNACLTITNVTLADGGAYQVALENAAGTLVSDSALLVFAVPDAPPGDSFADRVSLGTNSSGTVRSTNTFATKEPGEPDHAGKPGGASVWYQWTAPSNGVATFRTVGSAFDTLLAVYTGQSVDALTTVASDEDDGGFFTSLLSFNTTAGIDYAIALDGFGGVQGDFVLSWNLEATPDALPVITTQPTSRTVALGASTTLNVTASGSGLKYQWHFNGVALLNQTNSALTLPSVQATNVGNYLVAVTNSTGRGLRSDVAVLEIGPVPTVQSQDKFADLFLNAGGGGGGIGPASSGGFISVSIGTTTAPQILNNTGATTQSGEADHCIVISTATRWLRYRAENAGVMVIDTFGSAIPTVLEVYADVGAFGFPINSLACGKTNAPDGRNSRVSFATVAGKEYYVAADGFRGAVGIIQMNAALGQIPALPPLTPTNTLVEASESFVLSVPAPTNSTSQLRYQWQLNGRNILDATNATYLVSSADASAGGTYTVVVVNEFGSVTKTVAVVGVNIPYLRGDPQLLNGVLRLWVQRPAEQAVVVEGAGNLGAWTPLHTVPLTLPGPIVELPATNSLRFFRARPWP